MDTLRPKLEELAIGLFEARKEKAQLEKEIEDYIVQVKKELEKAEIRPDEEGKIRYDGSAVEVILSIAPSYNVILEAALKYGDVEILYKKGILTISRGKFEEYLKEKGIKLKEPEYLRAEGKSERLNVNRKDSKP